MKRTHLLILFISITQTAYAQPGPADAKKNASPESGQDRPRAQMDFWKRVDTNQDQKLSKAEFITLERISQLPAEKQDKLFLHLDKNQDGMLEPREMKGPGEGEGPGEEMKHKILPKLSEIDKNHDKKIDFDEFIQGPMVAKIPQERQRKMFDKMDRNKDGVLSPLDGPPEGRPLFDRDPRNEKGKEFPGKNPEGKNFENKNPNPEKLFALADTDHNGSISFGEFQQTPVAKNLGEDAQEDLFEKIDTNQDLKIDGQEMQQHHAKSNANGPMKKPEPGVERPRKPKPENGAPDEEMMMEDQ
jgi:Ca2+-binding EF-hand superfamily protein